MKYSLIGSVMAAGLIIAAPAFAQSNSASVSNTNPGMAAPPGSAQGSAMGQGNSDSMDANTQASGAKGAKNNTSIALSNSQSNTRADGSTIAPVDESNPTSNDARTSSEAMTSERLNSKN